MVPTRNEEDVIEQCLESLLHQSGAGFLLGRDWELLVIDDHSTDGTRQIAQRMRGVLLLDPDLLQPGWTGKANALWTAARQARGEWLLFTDADTAYQPGSLERALAEAEAAQSVLLSYSPRQVVHGLWQRSVMPLIFSELALAYSPEKVSDPNSSIAAANGQFLMIRQPVYFAIGGHAAVAGSLLEDVDLALLVKNRKLPIRFRYAPDALSTSMYRTTGAMIDGWTKNLARLFISPLGMAIWGACEWLLLVALPCFLWQARPRTWIVCALAALWVCVLWRFYARVVKSNFPAPDCLLAFLGLPLFCFLLARSWYLHAWGKPITWKGRQYPTRK